MVVKYLRMRQYKSLFFKMDIFDLVNLFEKLESENIRAILNSSAF
jgi:hypothetical protein